MGGSKTARIMSQSWMRKLLQHQARPKRPRRLKNQVPRVEKETQSHLMTKRSSTSQGLRRRLKSQGQRVEKENGRSPFQQLTTTKKTMIWKRKSSTSARKKFLGLKKKKFSEKKKKKKKKK